MADASLNDNHKRRLSTSMMMVDTATARMLDLIDGRTSPTLVSALQKSVPEAILGNLRDLLHQLQTGAAEFVHRHGLEKQGRNEKRILVAEASHLWIVLENCRPARMRGYGAISDREAKLLDSEIEALLVLVEDLRGLLVD